ncbi:MAG: hypothetical protein CMH77_04985 [Nitrospinae bacterium]|nr:hypothetical protein [Nitrospinota bacterium]
MERIITLRGLRQKRWLATGMGITAILRRFAPQNDKKTPYCHSEPRQRPLSIKLWGVEASRNGSQHFAFPLYRLLLPRRVDFLD